MASSLTTKQSFTYLTSAAWSSKKNQLIQQNSANDNLDQIVSKRIDAGEDALFHVSTDYGIIQGIADGVGSWGADGVDPTAFAWAMMENAADVAKELGSAENNPSKSMVDAGVVLTRAFENTKAGGKVEAGSATTSILTLSNDTGILNAAVLGDSAFLIIRNSRVHYQSASQQHQFNGPYQLAIIPDRFYQPGCFSDTPSEADQSTHQLQDGDIILLATDGLYDSIFMDEIVSIVNEELSINDGNTRNMDVEELTKSVRSLAMRLTYTARKYSVSTTGDTPYVKQYRACYHMSRWGGKVDDIALLVTLVRVNHE
ncbi:9999_t:CDS:2 [Paraglomus occultum]|uniref:Protein phosphatase n=1 Tax=Paraglomus occultum TaxID=144539 RepID=A0A9N8WNK6_9GLOM|nr:9999_t:CDS:2 [Paraglomus occultum]